jgi:peptide/nickel transport system substrate-binding protein
MTPFRSRALAALLGAALLGAAAVSDAVTLRWAGRGDMHTTDPHSQNENLTNNLNALIYEFLVMRDKQLGIIPDLAESWTQVNPTTWRFKLRPGVKFHDGTPFTADDVVFSFERAKADSSQLRAYANATGQAKKIDDLTVEFVTPGPNPTMLEHVITINIMSKAWCEKNRATKPQNYTQKEDMITAKQANGTGPYMLVSREPDVKTVLKKNPNWWGLKAGQFDGNVDDLVYTPIVSDATRVAALISGEVDLINDPPPQDVPRLKETPNIKVLEGVENRIVFIGMDQKRDELLYSNVKGKNPFKDKRVREALYSAIDIDAINRTTMRGLSKPSGAMLPNPRCRRRKSRSGCRSTARRRRSCSPTQATRRDSRSRSTARITATSTTRRSARHWRRCGRRSASTSRSTRCPGPTTSRSSRRPRPACTCSAGAVRLSTRSSSCSRCCRRTAARVTATTTTAATPMPSSTS